MVLHGRPEFPLRAGEVLEVPAIRGLDPPPERGVLVVVRCQAVVVVVVVMLLSVMRLLVMGVVVLRHRGRGGLVPEVALFQGFLLFTIISSSTWHPFSCTMV